MCLIHWTTETLIHVFHDAKKVRKAIPLNDINHEVPMPSKEIGSNDPILILRED
jgi:hypothetical protein